MYYQKQAFIDRYQIEPSQSVDVIIPIIHTNELWRQNLLSIYREIPVNRLLIGDGGCIDNSVLIAKEFPRVVVFNHHDYHTLGFSIRKLIEAVETEWFVYLHSDVYLPSGWFDMMSTHQSSLDWIECPPVLTVLVELPLDHSKTRRSFSGAQMGKVEKFKAILPIIEDDYLYRNEDIVISELLHKARGKFARVTDTFHYHQEMYKPSTWQRKVKSVKFQWDMSREVEERASLLQIKGIVKYLTPREDIPLDHYDYLKSVKYLYDEKVIQPADLERWIFQTNPGWLPVHRKKIRQERFNQLIEAGNEFIKALKEFFKTF